MKVLKADDWGWGGGCGQQGHLCSDQRRQKWDGGRTQGCLAEGGIVTISSCLSGCFVGPWGAEN